MEGSVVLDMDEKWKLYHARSSYIIKVLVLCSHFSLDDIDSGLFEANK